MVAKKSFIHTLKPQIPSVEPRKRRLGIRTIPCVFREERRIKKFWCVFWMFFLCFLVFGREKNMEKNQAESKTQKKNVLPQVWGVPGAIYSPGMNFEVTALQPPKAFNWVNLDTPGKLLTSCFWKGMELENLTVGSKVMTPWSFSESIDALSQFSWYLDRPNSDFDPWIVVGMRIW